MTKESPLFRAVVEGDAGAVSREVRTMLDRGISPRTILEKDLIPAMGEVGARFESNEYFVPELLIAARAMQEGMKILNPLLVEAGVEKHGRVILGTVKGDLHDIGKNLVGAMLEGGGFEVIDLGVDVPAEQFVEESQKKADSIICLSALLTTTMPQMRIVIESLEKAGIRESVKVMVGGAPITEEFAREIGADGYGNNATEAVLVARKLRTEQV